MTVWRVGAEGAVVFNEKGEPLATLRPGQVVVPGTLDTPGSLADQHRKLTEQKRVKRYADKKLRPEEDKA